jgi:hypothetical protein
MMFLICVPPSGASRAGVSRVCEVVSDESRFFIIDAGRWQLKVVFCVDP